MTDTGPRSTGLKRREKEFGELVIAAGHEAQLFKTQLDQLEEQGCKCGHTPSAVEYVAPPVENLIPIPVSAPCCQGNLSMVCPALEEIVEELRELIVEDLDALPREVDEGRARDLQEGSSCSVVCPSPRVGSKRWKNSMGFTKCVQGAAEGSRELLL